MEQTDEGVVEIGLSIGDDVDDHEPDALLHITAAFRRKSTAMFLAVFVTRTDEFNSCH